MVAVLLATAFKSIIYEDSAEIDVQHLKGFSQNFENSSSFHFEGMLNVDEKKLNVILNPRFHKHFFALVSVTVIVVFHIFVILF